MLFDLENEKKEIEGPKLYLLKLIEFNKIAILEKHGYSTATLSHHGGHIMIEDEQQITEVQQCMTRLMRQTVIWEELRHELEDYDFEGSLAEQKAIVFSLVKMSKKLIGILYKKCFNFTIVKQKNPPHPTDFASLVDFSTMPGSGSTSG